MSLPLISFDEYKAGIAMKCNFNGFFWTKDGNIFKVHTCQLTTQLSHPSYPNHKSIWYVKGSRFFDHDRKQITITLQEIGNDDVVYDEDGNFICTRIGHDPERKGEIYIRKFNKKNRDMNASYSEHWGIQLKEFEDAPLKAPRLKDALSAEAYSKIFTHILSLDSEIKKDLAGLRDGKISIQLLTSPETYSNMTADDRYKWPNQANAFANSKTNIVAGIVSPAVVNNDLYATLWNVMNLLGVHEIKHVTFPWTGNDEDTHHLNYLFQKGHHSWKKTTRSFKSDMIDKLKSEYYTDYQKDMESRLFDEKYIDYKRLGIYPRSGETFESIENRVINRLNSRDGLKELDDYFRKKDDNYKDYKKRNW